MSQELDASAIRAQARAVLEAHWMPEGYTAPNPHTYPWQWLWDSCFHAVCWAALGDDRGLVELRTALSVQAADGFVPHMNYVRRPDVHVDLWGRRGASSITQPPMYGHAVAELVRRGMAMDEDIVLAAERGLRFLLFNRARHSDGLVLLCHPWESGADDSPRWDDYCPGTYTLQAWRVHKNQLVHGIRRTAHGSPLENPAFRAASAGFNALIVFNARQLAEVTGRSEVSDRAEELAGCLSKCWDAERRTWADSGPATGGSGRVRTLDGLLPLLVDDDPARIAEVVADLLAPAAYGGDCGPAGMHRAEPDFAPRTYWRGPAWPQLSYLLWLGLRLRGLTEAAASVAASTLWGVTRSGFAEYWDPDDGTPGGAVPQSWSALVVAMTSLNKQELVPPSI